MRTSPHPEGISTLAPVNPVLSSVADPDPDLGRGQGHFFGVS